MLFTATFLLVNVVVVVVTSLFDAKNDNKSLKPVASKSTRTALVVALSLVVTNTCAAFAEELFFFILSSLRAFLGKMLFFFVAKKKVLHFVFSLGKQTMARRESH